MKHVSRRSGWPLALVATAASLAIAGCASETVWSREDLARQIADADTPAEHERIAAWFEREAATARSQAEIHRRMMERYEEVEQRPTRGLQQMAPYADLEQRPPRHAADFIKLCESRIRASEEAAAEYAAFAERHRTMAAESAD
jgi:hypothetical protein